METIAAGIVKRRSTSERIRVVRVTLTVRFDALERSDARFKNSERSRTPSTDNSLCRRRVLASNIQSPYQDNRFVPAVADFLGLTIQGVGETSMNPRKLADFRNYLSKNTESPAENLSDSIVRWSMICVPIVLYESVLGAKQQSTSRTLSQRVKQGDVDCFDFSINAACLSS